MITKKGETKDLVHFFNCNVFYWKNDLAYFAQKIGQLFDLVDNGVLHAGLAEAEVSQLPEGEATLLNPLGSSALEQTWKSKKYNESLINDN